MCQRKYYSARKHGTRIDLDLLRELFHSLFRKLQDDGYFQESMGYSCVDVGWVSGTLGSDLDAAFFRALRKHNMYPSKENCDSYSEEDLFDVIECLHDQISKPLDGQYHSYNDCGWHYHTFDKDVGQAEFRQEVSAILADYEDGYELSPDGEILATGEPHMRGLLNSQLPSYDPGNVEQRVEAAVKKFLRYRSSPEDRRDAVKSLADVVEFLRPKLKTAMLRKDEADLFNIANNFGLRHHNRQQKTDYEQRIWLTWMFYVYLATIQAVVRVLARTHQDAD